MKRLSSGDLETKDTEIFLQRRSARHEQRDGVFREQALAAATSTQNRSGKRNQSTHRNLRLQHWRRI